MFFLHSLCLITTFPIAMSGPKTRKELWNSAAINAFLVFRYLVLYDIFFRGDRSVVAHLTLTHFRDAMTRELQLLQVAFGDDNHCPISGCTEGKGASWDFSLLYHYAFDHHRAMDMLISAGKDAFSDPARWNLIKLRKKDRMQLQCNVCPPGSSPIFSTKEAVQLHMVTEHFYIQLWRKFLQNCVTLTSGVKCKICSKLIPLNCGAIHMGIVHGGIADCMTTLSMKRKHQKSPEERQVPQQQCHVCAQKFSSYELLKSHFVEAHFSQVLTVEILKNLPTCPARVSCETRTDDVSRMKTHLTQAHAAFVDALLGELLKETKEGYASRMVVPSNVHLTKCVADPLEQEESSSENETAAVNTLDSSQDEEEDSMLAKAFNSFLAFCSSRNIKKSLVFQVGLFLKMNSGEVWMDQETIPKLLTKIDKTQGTEMSKSAGLANICKSLKKRSHTNSPVPMTSQSESSTPGHGTVDVIETTISSDAKIDLGIECHQCNRLFGNISSLVTHISLCHDGIFKSDGVVISCRFCEYHRKLLSTNIEMVSRVFTLHALSKTHIYNRWLQGKEGQKRCVTEDSVNTCEPCFEISVSDVDAHIITKKHIDNVRLISDFLEYCRLREICPVTCTPGDICFYLDLAYRDYQAETRISLHKISTTLSSIHDSVDGVELFDVPEVDKKVQALTMASKAKPVVFICYSCPFSSHAVEEMTNHATSFKHCFVTKTRCTSAKVFSCNLCKRFFESLIYLELHQFNTRHVRNVYAPAFNRVMLPDDGPDDTTFCHLCESDVGDVCEGHINSPLHKLRCDSLQRYLQFCNANSLDPTAIDMELIKTFFRENFEGQGCDNDVVQCLLVISNIHDKIEEVPLARNESLRKFLKELTGSKDTTYARVTAVEQQDQEDSSSRAATSLDEDHAYETFLSKKDILNVVQCRICQEIFPHATFLLLHIRHVHCTVLRTFLGEQFVGKEPTKCVRCLRQCVSPLAFALHYDRHHARKQVQCTQCKRLYISPSSLYLTDHCAKNSMPEDLKKEVASAIVEALTVQNSDNMVGETFLRSLSGVDKAREEEDETGEREKNNDSDYVADQEEDSTDELEHGDCHWIGNSSQECEQGEKYVTEEQVPDCPQEESDVTEEPFPLEEVAPVTQEFELEKAESQVTVEQGLNWPRDEKHVNDQQGLDYPEENQIKEEHRADSLKDEKHVNEQQGLDYPEENQIKEEHQADSSKDELHIKEDHSSLKSCSVPVSKLEKTLADSAGNNVMCLCPTIRLKRLRAAEDCPGKVHLESAKASPSRPGKPTTSKKRGFAPTSDDPKPSPKRAKVSCGAVSKLKKNVPREKPKPLSKRLSQTRVDPEKEQKGRTTAKEKRTKKSSRTRRKGPRVQFCLDCEGCSDVGCDHSSHPRILIGGASAVANHVKTKNHSRLQRAEDFLPLKLRVHVDDVAYGVFGRRVRKKFKKCVSFGEVKLDMFRNGGRPCKVRGCSNVADNPLTLFRHIREQHL